MKQLEETATRSSDLVPVLAGVGFLLAYMLVGPVTGALADRDLPLPDAAAAEVSAYYAANGTVALTGAALQLVSVGFLFWFAVTIPIRGKPTGLAWLAVASMVVSCATTGVITAVAGDVSDQTLALLRQVSFYAGGAAHVVLLGLFTLSAATILYQESRVGRGIRTFGYAAGAIAVLSVLSVAIYYANAFLPLGRVLCMVWILTAAVALWRPRR